MLANEIKNLQLNVLCFQSFMPERQSWASSQIGEIRELGPWPVSQKSRNQEIKKSAPIREPFPGAVEADLATSSDRPRIS